MRKALGIGGFPIELTVNSNSAKTIHLGVPTVEFDKTTWRFSEFF